MCSFHSQEGMIAEPVKTDRMWKTVTCYGIYNEILISDLEHMGNAAVDDEVIHLGGSTSRVCYC